MTNIKGQTCRITDSSNLATSSSSIVCQVPAWNNVASQEYAGNRGITLIVDTGVSKTSSDIAQAVPSINAQYSEIQAASYKASASGAQTIWLKGFLAPEKTSTYSLNLVTNGIAELYLSTDSTVTNRVKIASTSTSKTALVQLVANTQ